jgi:hypothetical protein
MQGFAYFPTIVYREERPELASKVNEFCLQQLQGLEVDCAVKQSASLVLAPDLNELKTYLVREAGNILYSQGYDTSKYELYVSDLWAQEIKSSGFTEPHIHKNSQVCGWIFLETPEEGSYPIYFDSRYGKEFVSLHYEITETVTNATESIHFKDVIPGTVLFNNSWLKHSLSFNKNSSPTRCIHFIVSHKEK